MHRIKGNRIFQLFCSAAFAMFLCILVLSGTWYTSMRQAVQQQKDEEDKRELSLLNYSINTTNEKLRILSINTFYHTLCQEYISAEADAPVNVELLVWLKDILRNNPIIHSVELYNNRSQTLLSVTQSGWKQTHLQPEESIFKGAALLQPTLSVDGESQFFQYFMYDSVDRESVTDGALVFGVEKVWLADILNSLSRPESQLIVASRSGQVIAESSRESLVDNAILDHIQQLKTPESHFDLGGRFLPEYAVSYLTIPNSGWRLISIRPYRAVYGHLYALTRYSVAFVGSVMLFIAVIGGCLLHRSREPLKLLAECVTAGNIQDLSQPKLFDDEITQIRQTLYTTLYEKERLNEILSETEKFFQENLLKMLLRGEVNAQTPLIRLYVTQLLRQDLQGYYVILCIRLFGSLPALPQMVIHNLQEADGVVQVFRTGLEYAIDTIVLHFDRQPDVENTMRTISETLPVGCRISGSRPTAQVGDLAVLYQEAMSQLLWSAYGIQPLPAEQAEFRFPHEMLTALLDALRKCDLDKAMDALSGYLSAVPYGMNDLLVAALIHLAAALDGFMEQFDPECRYTICCGQAFL